jgi:formylglycine-generating enzyme required for sulfatase activity
MGKYDVTVGQYCQFLNAVAKADPYGLYCSSHNSGYSMARDYQTIGITQDGNSGSYSYSIKAGYSQAANCPIFDVSWGSAARFCNWLQNGLPTGPEGNGTTETGAYTLNGAVTDSGLSAITRNAGARYFIPTENEWYKAAYFDPGLNGGVGAYWTCPTRSNNTPSNTLSATGTNNANFYDSSRPGNSVFSDSTNYLTSVGAFAASPGTYGTFDMGGELWQWNEANPFGDYRGVRGGSFDFPPSGLISSSRGAASASYESVYYGFRVAASVPEPGSITLVVVGGLCLLAYAWRRRRV